MDGQRIQVGGPFFEDFHSGQIFDEAPAITLTSGHAALYQAFFGDRLRLPLDVALSAAVTGRHRIYAHPLLVCNVAIGQSTGPSQRVRGNLFYRGLVFRRPVFIGDTLRTRTEVAGLKQNRVRSGKPATGLVALRIRVENQQGDVVLDFWRCPMIPLRDPSVETGHSDTFEEIPAGLDLEEVRAAIPKEWRLAVLFDSTRTVSPHFPQVSAGTTYAIEARDTITSAPELARLTLNIASVHTDAGASAYGRRLVYGGHTISMCFAQVMRALPNLATLLAWRSCEHTGPVFEGDRLRSEVTVEEKHPLDRETGLLDLRALVFAQGAEEEPERPVLDWRFLALCV